MSPTNDNAPSKEAELVHAMDLLRQSRETVQVLAREQQRLRRQVGLILVTALLAVVSVAMATISEPQPVNVQSVPSAASAAEREALLSMLSAGERARIDEFEKQVQWMSSYMKSSAEFDAGAAVALFLSRVADNMSSIPKMHQEMQVMNSRMAAVPAIVAEMQAINAKLTVMTGAMDSTMGRAGRMFPWMPFSP
jgi:hypothetical protein